MFTCDVHGLPLIPGPGGAHDLVCQLCIVDEDVRRDIAQGRRPVVSAARFQLGSRRHTDDGDEWDWETVK